MTLISNSWIDPTPGALPREGRRPEQKRQRPFSDLPLPFVMLTLPGIRGRSDRDGRENLVAETSSRPPTTTIRQQHEDGVGTEGVTHSTKFLTIRLTRFSMAFLPDRPISPRSSEALLPFRLFS